MDFEELLESKPLYYKEFDPQRIVDAYRLIESHIKHPKRVQLIGTNGKGSTGRALAHLAYKSGLSVGHYTSPHILDFKERFWQNGTIASFAELEAAHQKLFSLLGEDVAFELSYFEYLTLLAFVLFENCDLQVIEAGLGGEYDATSVANYALTVITPIGLDHSDFLGKTIKEVAQTKLEAMAQKVVIAKQEKEEVYEIAQEIAKSKGSKLFFCKDKSFNEKTSESIVQKLGYPEYLLENIKTAIAALDTLGVEYDIKDLESLKLFGRFYRLRENITIDVGHNTLAAEAIVKALKGRVVLIFNILSDKDAKEVLTILKPKVEYVEIIRVNTQRETDMHELQKIIESVGLPYKSFDNRIEAEKEYLVFGSFYTVEAFLKAQGVKSIESE